jgi:hypothetical protein
MEQAQETEIPTEMSRTAVLAAMFALPLCCPPMSLLACITGTVALLQIRRNPSLRGRWLAWSAIAVGAICTTVMSALLWTHGLSLLVRGPTPPLRAIMNASPTDMQRDWSGPATSLDAAQLRAFADQLRERYGEFVEASASDSRTAPLKPTSGGPIATLPIQMRFERSTVQADLGLELFDERSGATVMRWRSLRVIDPAAGELTFPPGEPPPEPLQSAPAKPPASAPSKPALR